MADQEARRDPNHNPAILGHSSTADPSETRRIIVTDGAMHTVNMGGVSPVTAYDNLVVTYPDGTTETYTYKSGTTSVGTTTLVYLDANKGSLSTVTRS